MTTAIHTAHVSLTVSDTRTAPIYWNGLDKVKPEPDRHKQQYEEQRDRRNPALFRFYSITAPNAVCRVSQ